MNSFRRNACVILCVLVAVLTGCRPKKKPQPASVSFQHELPAGELALRKISPSEYPDFTSSGHDDPQQVLQAIDQSLAYLKAPSSRRHFPYLDITHDRAVA